MHLEVRCCCTPRKLLGWLFVPGDPGYLVSFQVRGDDGEMDFMTLPVAMISIPGTPPYRAIKAEGVSLDVLRQLSGFVEAREADFN